MKYKHIIWDWNGTLLNDRWLCVLGINQSLKKRGLPEIDDVIYKDIFTFPVQEYYATLGFNFEEEPFEVAGDEFVDFYNQKFHEVQLHKGSESILKSVCDNGATQSILSAGKHDYLIDWVRFHNLENFFINVLGINNHYATGKTKLGISLMEQLPYLSDEILLIGDTIHDSKVASEMNIDCILVDHGHVSAPRLITTGRKIFKNLNQVYRYLI